MSKEKKIHLKINNIDVEVDEGTTILEAAKKVNINIPTLCYLKDLNGGGCRMCLVKIEGRKDLTVSCIQKVEEGMNVKTNTKEIIEARKLMLELLLSNHERECLTCIRNENCELQKLSKDLNVREIEYEGEKSKYEIDDLSPSIVRDLNKCILCRRCIATCKNVQSVGAINAAGRGFETRISTVGNESLNNVDCTFCGQCIKACPTGALHEKETSGEIWEKLSDEETHVVVQTAPAVRVALGEEFGMPVGKNVTGKMVTALKQLGFDKVFDTNTGADLTIIEEANEFIERIKENKVLPMITSCSPGWIRFIELNYPELIPHLSTCKSPHQMYGAIIKSYYAEKQNIDPSKIYNVSVMPCIAKKFERTRKNMSVNGLDDVDNVITTRELARMIKQAGINFKELEEGKFDDPMGEATGAAAIFGTTGGVMEAALRTAADTLEGKEIENLKYTDVRGNEGIKRASLVLAGKEIKIVVAHGLSNAKIIMEEIKQGKADYQFVEIMACPGGCIMGGGQPIHNNQEIDKENIREKRAEALYTIDEKSQIRKSHENPVMKKLYNEYLESPGSHKAHELLHTTYENRKA